MRFPGESDAYRAARDKLLEAEIELSPHVEAVAAQRRALPVGGLIPEDYAFTEGPADLAVEAPLRTTQLSDLFGTHDALLLYSFMYGPEMAKACRMCTSLLDGLDGAAPDIRERVGFAVIAKSPIERIRTYARLVVATLERARSDPEGAWG